MTYTDSINIVALIVVPIVDVLLAKYLQKDKMKWTISLG